MTKNKEAIFTSENQGWITPEVVLKALGPIALDTCTWPDNPTKALAFYTVDDDGLKLSWSKIGLNYCNPPYSKFQIKWIKKAIAEYICGCENVLLIPARTDTKIWQDWIFPTAKAICFIKGRLKFIDPDTRKFRKNGATFPSALVYYGKDPKAFEVQVKHLGHVVIGGV